VQAESTSPRGRRRTLVDPPRASEVETIIATVPKRWRLPLRVLAETGMRVGELHALEWGDVDETESRFRVKAGKTAAARRWFPCPRTSWPRRRDLSARGPYGRASGVPRLHAGRREERDGSRLQVRRDRPSPSARLEAPVRLGADRSRCPRDDVAAQLGHSRKCAHAGYIRARSSGRVVGGPQYRGPPRSDHTLVTGLRERLRNHLTEEREVTLEVGMRALDRDLARDELAGLQVEGVCERNEAGITEKEHALRRLDLLR
jgi:integrase